jgi:hypothetical protein
LRRLPQWRGCDHAVRRHWRLVPQAHSLSRPYAVSALSRTVLRPANQRQGAAGAPGTSTPDHNNMHDLRRFMVP